MGWEGAAGLAADVRAYGEWMRDEAFKRIGEHYPQATLEDGTKATVIAWIWARTVTCPNPACGIEMPLVRSWWLSKKKAKEAWIKPIVVDDNSAPSGKRVTYEIRHGHEGAPSGETDGTVGRQGALCVACGSAVPLAYVREEGQGQRIGNRLMAIVAKGDRRRLYVAASAAQEELAAVPRPEEVPEGNLSNHPQYMGAPRYGMLTWADLFSDRQLLAIATVSGLVAGAREQLLQDALDVGLQAGERLEAGGVDAEAYADAVATFLAFSVSRCADYWSSLSTWSSTRETIRNVFGRQAIPMAWDFAEAMPFSSSTGGFTGQLSWVAKVIEGLPTAGSGEALQADASARSTNGGLISTDPPYYDNVPYADLSDFFYVWLRSSLRTVHPNLLSTLLVPKADELVANTQRHSGKEGARASFEAGFARVFANAREEALPEFPITVYYAFRQSEIDRDGKSSTGWETLLGSLIGAGWTISATWPVRSELSNRLRDRGSNALASSIVLALRPRPDDAPTIDRRGFMAALQDELPGALRELQQGAIAPVDLPQAAIGPGMAVFSGYSKVIEDDGSQMSVRSALARINEILDQVLNEQEGDFDADTRFAIEWYRQCGYASGVFGEADNMARGRNTAVETLARGGILTSAAGKVTLIAPHQLPEDYDVLADERVSVWEVLHHLISHLDRDGLPAAGAFLADVQERPDGAVNTELVKELAFLLFAIAEAGGRTQDAISFNTVATAWPDIVEASRSRPLAQAEQGSLDFAQES